MCCKLCGHSREQHKNDGVCFEGFGKMWGDECQCHQFVFKDTK